MTKLIYLVGTVVFYYTIIQPVLLVRDAFVNTLTTTLNQIP